MNKRILIVLLAFITQITFAQQKWVKFGKEKNIEFNEEHKLHSLEKEDFPLKINKDEILENKKDGTKDFVLYGKDTLRCPSGFASVEIEEEVFKSILNIKSTLLQKQKKSNEYKIDITSLKPFYAEEKRITKPIVFIVDKKVEFKDETSAIATNIPAISKLLIPELPTIYFKRNELIEYTIKEEKKEKFSIDTLNTGKSIAVTSNPIKVYSLPENFNEKEKNLNKIKNKRLLKEGKHILESESFLFYSRYIKKDGTFVKKSEFKYILILWLVLIVAFLFFLYKILKKHFGKPIYLENVYERGSFNEFVKGNNTTIKKLARYNRELKHYDSNKEHNSERNFDILENIKHIKLIKGKSFFIKKQIAKPTSEREGKNTTERDVKKQYDTSNNKNEITAFISQQFEKQSSLIKDEFNTFKSNSKSQDDELKVKLNEKNVLISSLNNNLDERNAEINDLKVELETTIAKKSNVKDLYSAMEKDLTNYKSLVKFTPYLKTLGYNYLSLLDNINKCNKGLNNIIINKNDELTSDEINTLFKINYIYPNKIDSNDWKNMFTNLSNGFISDPELLSMLNDFQNEDEKIEFIRKYVYNNFWEKFINAILLNMEAIRILDSFTGQKTDFTTKLSLEANKFIKLIISKTKELAGLDINYVNFLSNYENYSFTKVSSDKAEDIFLKLPCKSEDILKIISFGFKNNHQFENEKTWVIIK